MLRWVVLLLVLLRCAASHRETLDNVEEEKEQQPSFRKLGRFITTGLGEAEFEQEDVAVEGAGFDQEDVVIMSVKTSLQESEAFWFEQKLDHFDPYEKQTFQQRYFIDTTYYEPDGPIFLTPGGEATMDRLPYGLGFELAKRSKGLYVALEHRFYGESIPFGGNRTKAFQPTAEYLGKLSIEQALGDLETFVNFVKLKYPNGKVIAFGGSYSGKLSAYFRYTAPHLCDGALASSAPMFLDGADLGISQFAYYRIVTEAAEKTFPGCIDGVRKAIGTLLHAENGAIEKAIPLCSTLSSKDDLIQLIRIHFANSAMSNYPPRTKTAMYRACQALTGKEGLDAWSDFFKDEKGKETCLDMDQQRPIFCSDFSGCGTGWSGIAWDFQATTQVVQPIGTNNVTDMFPPFQFSVDWIRHHAQKVFRNVTVREHGLAQRFGLNTRDRTLKHFTKVIWSNGLLDPWSAGGVLRSKMSIIIPNGAHHSELGAASPLDSQDVIAARKREVEIIENEFLKN